MSSASNDECPSADERICEVEYYDYSYEFCAPDGVWYACGPRYGQLITDH